MAVDDLVRRMLEEPSPDVLWHLHPHLLAVDDPAAAPARDLSRMFYCYLSCVRSKLTSKQYSSLAAMLAAGSIGVIALEDIVEAVASGEQNMLYNLLAGGLAATLETLSTLQHVQAWETEFASVHEEAVWQLYDALWAVSVELQPGLEPTRRHALIDSLLSPVRDPAVHSAARMALVIRLFQFLLVIRLAPLLPTIRAGEQAAVTE